MEIVKIMGMVDSYGYLTSEVRYYLNRHAGKDVTLVISSLGGDVSEALKISELIKSHGKVTVRFIGCNASAATWMVYPAVKVEAAEDSLFLIHKCSNFVSLYKAMKTEDIDKEIKRLESMKKSQEAFNLTIAKKYYAHCEGKGKTFEDVLKLMEEERWITAEDAMEFGLIDSVIQGDKMSKNEMETTMNFCSENNLPIPKFAEEKTLVQQILDGVKSLLAPAANKGNDDGTPAENSEGGPEGNDDPNGGAANVNANVESPTDKPQTTNFMYKLLFNLCALLGIATANQTEEKPENATLTADQLQKIEDSLAEGKKAKDDLESILGVLDGISDNVKNMDGAKNKALAVAALIQNFPGFAPANQTPGKGESDKKMEALKNVAKDPVNEEMQNFYHGNKK